MAGRTRSYFLREAAKAFKQKPLCVGKCYDYHFNCSGCNWWSMCIDELPLDKKPHCFNQRKGKASVANCKHCSVSLSCNEST